MPWRIASAGVWMRTSFSLTQMRPEARGPARKWRG